MKNKIMKRQLIENIIWYHNILESRHINEINIEQIIKPYEVNKYLCDIKTFKYCYNVALRYLRKNEKKR